MTFDIPVHVHSIVRSVASYLEDLTAGSALASRVKMQVDISNNFFTMSQETLSDNDPTRILPEYAHAWWKDLGGRHVMLAAPHLCQAEEVYLKFVSRGPQIRREHLLSL